MLSDDQYQSIKVSTLTAAEVANQVVTSPSTVYYDEEGYQRVYEAMTLLRHHLCVVYSELDLFRSMFREQISEALNEQRGETERSVDGVSPGGDAVEQTRPDGGDDSAKSDDEVEEPRPVPKTRRKRAKRGRNKKSVPATKSELGSPDGAGEVGGTQED